MPPGRPSKRTGESADGNSSDEHSIKVKSQRTQRGSTQSDFSSVVKSKLQSYTRTGQACDRCKVRKIRCDAFPEGCSHCISQNLECYVTDRVTGRTERRGYTQELEREKAAMLAQIRTLEKRLEANGIHAARFQWPQSLDSPGRSSSRSQLDISHQDVSQQTSHLTTPMGPPCPFTNSESTSLSVSQDANPNRPQLVAFKSLTLSILGNDIDLGAFGETDLPDPSLRVPDVPLHYSPSEKMILHMMLNLQRPTNVELPPWSEALRYAEWWFANIYPFLPILHRPTFLSNLKLLYEDPVSPSLAPADIVGIHVVFATTLRQISFTSLDHSKRPHLAAWSEKHYHYALGRFSEVVVSRNLQDVRAIALILFHATRFSKPRVSAYVANQALSLAMELGLNRARPSHVRTGRLEEEMRKRLWWAILWLTITIHGRTGRPMPIGLHDMDIDYPDALSDEALEEQSGNTIGVPACPFLVGLWIMKATRMYLHMYSSIYSIRSKSSAYLISLQALEQQLKNWQDSLPDSLQLTEADLADAAVSDFHALYIHYTSLNLQLYLRHPMALPSEDPALLDSTLQANEENSKRLLRCLLALHKIGWLEATWLALGTYTSGAFLHLTSYWHRRNILNEHDMLDLRRDMMSWFMIINETSQLLDNGQRLSAAINDIIQRVLTWIEHDYHRLANDARSLHTPRDMAAKRTAQESGQIPHMSSMVPNQRLADSSSRGNVSYDLPSRTGFYPDPSVSDPGVYSQSTGYPGTQLQPPNPGAPYNPGHPFTYEGQIRMEPPHGHEHSSGPTPRTGASMDPYAPGGAPPMPQTSQPMMWRPPISTTNTHDIEAGMANPSGSGPHAGATWSDWNTPIPGSQEHRYGSHSLVGMGPGPRQETRPDSGMPVGPEREMNMGPGVPVTGNDMPWPGLMYPASSERQQRPQ
ncbi:fungal-specific transcription factor domain-containing protein [Microdochium trichocladiopsis]|uniref:Fungal-specific transcription factor domain-containing protein n=1 Tax=Microdochium trichocladiopsis TaxID=1682393 RepID=A0A9P9BKM0_9PEZI|nr:fungal-specific transcription factor domain-containing protein [Microdochium trichocladiopsis]KAH7010638.1 fungal-specific transcription factor domain-containing protein [Microdochium trichocladiopsis]